MTNTTSKKGSRKTETWYVLEGSSPKRVQSAITSARMTGSVSARNAIIDSDGNEVFAEVFRNPRYGTYALEVQV